MYGWQRSVALSLKSMVTHPRATWQQCGMAAVAINLTGREYGKVRRRDRPNSGDSLNRSISSSLSIAGRLNSSWRAWLTVTEYWRTNWQDRSASEQDWKKGNLRKWPFEDSCVYPYAARPPICIRLSGGPLFSGGSIRPPGVSSGAVQPENRQQRQQQRQVVETGHRHSPGFCTWWWFDLSARHTIPPTHSKQRQRPCTRLTFCPRRFSDLLPILSLVEWIFLFDWSEGENPVMEFRSVANLVYWIDMWLCTRCNSNCQFSGIDQLHGAAPTDRKKTTQLNPL